MDAASIDVLWVPARSPARRRAGELEIAGYEELDERFLSLSVGRSPLGRPAWALL
jgi:hypothetical protein